MLASNWNRLGEQGRLALLHFNFREVSPLNGTCLAPYSAPRTTEAIARAFNFASDHTISDVIIDQPHRLHEGIDGGGSDELPALFFQIFRQRKRLR